ncbi:hypothetical protein AB0Q95_36945, partial [Streptomyces sp. NPDC059900]
MAGTDRVRWSSAMACARRVLAAVAGRAAPAVPHPEIPEWQQRTGSIAFASPHLGADGALERVRAAGVRDVVAMVDA